MHMPQAFYPFFKFCDDTWLGQTVRGNTYMFPFIETVHIAALTVLVGCILMLDLRMLGLFPRNLTTYQMNLQMKKYMNWGLVVILVTGVLLGLSEALKCFDNDAFAPKMIFLALAIALHFTGHRRAVSINSDRLPLWTKAVAVLSLIFWFGVGWAGRAIGFV